MKALDMITQIEIADAIKNYAKVEARVTEVAFMVAKANREFKGVESPRWRVEKFSFSNGLNEVEPSCHVRFSILWHNRPATEKYGDPDDEDIGYTSSQEYLHRYIAFPTRYLTSTDWILEMERKAAESRAWWKQKHIEQLREQIRAESKRLENMRAKLREMEA